MELKLSDWLTVRAKLIPTQESLVVATGTGSAIVINYPTYVGMRDSTRTAKQNLAEVRRSTSQVWGHPTQVERRSPIQEASL